MKQTAVEWLIKEFNLENYEATCKFALQKEKKQMKKAKTKTEISDVSQGIALQNQLESKVITELSDEDIEKAADKYVSEDEFNRYLICFEEGAKWYREQLKQRQ